MIAKILIISLVLVIVDAVGRNPTSVEHNACRVHWSEHLTEVKKTYKDERVRIVAYNKGLEGSPCLTSCRILFRGNSKELEDIQTPDDVQCSSGPHPRVIENIWIFSFFFFEYFFSFGII
ncbi:hypothetical protein QR98_0083010 [Sarcoptes scabiei]|uniref:Uncharacterized protein n=1 Tax=Sarcoptes scabiei TaxID=52283 RepID=A0A132AFJ8_SARSC|nr:hypothetical protein QR98_0083010 [Sarcoptes scabiei]